MVESKINHLKNVNEQQLSQETIISESFNSKSEQDFFGEKLDSVEECADNTMVTRKAQTPTEESDYSSIAVAKANENAEAASRRQRLIKRRYKSGLPLTTDRGDDDSIEESYMKQYCDRIISKQSKDDTGNSV